MVSQTGAGAEQSAAVSHAVETQVCPTQVSPSAHARFSSVTPNREQSAGSLQQKAGLISVEQLARSTKETAPARSADAPARSATGHSDDRRGMGWGMAARIVGAA
jgi:hypothetical protein